MPANKNKKPASVKVETKNIEVAKLGLETASKILGTTKTQLERAVANLQKEVEALTEALDTRANEILEQEVTAASKFAEAIETENQKLESARAAYAEEKKHLDEEFADTKKRMDEELREAELDLQLQIRESELDALSTLAKKHDKTIVEESVYTNLQEAVAKAESEKAKAVQAAINGIKESLERESEIALERLQLTHNAEKAQLTANNTSLQEQLDSSKEENKRLSEQLDSLREAMVRMQEANARPSVTIANSDKK